VKITQFIHVLYQYYTTAYLVFTSLHVKEPAGVVDIDGSFAMINKHYNRYSHSYLGVF